MSNSIDWSKRVMIATALIFSVLAAVLSSVFTTYLTIVIVLLLAAKEYGYHASHVISSSVSSNNGNNKPWTASSNFFRLGLATIIFSGICYLDPNPVPGNLFVLATFASTLCLPVYHLVYFCCLVDNRSESSQKRPLACHPTSPLVSMVCALGLDLLFFFFFVWPLASAIYCRKLAYGKGYTIMVFATCFISDTGALVAGSKWGTLKLAPSISPRKSVQGILGCLASAICTQLVLFGLSNVEWLGGFFPRGSVFDYINIGVIMALAGTIGDLLESAFKRAASTKDSSQIFGVHGGMLDRLDSLAVTIPLVMCYISLFIENL